MAKENEMTRTVSEIQGIFADRGCKVVVTARAYDPSEGEIFVFGPGLDPRFPEVREENSSEIGFQFTKSSIVCLSDTRSYSVWLVNGGNYIRVSFEDYLATAPEHRVAFGCFWPQRGVHKHFADRDYIGKKPFDDLEDAFQQLGVVE